MGAKKMYCLGIFRMIVHAIAVFRAVESRREDQTQKNTVKGDTSIKDYKPAGLSVLHRQYLKYIHNHTYMF